MESELSKIQRCGIPSDERRNLLSNFQKRYLEIHSKWEEECQHTHTGNSLESQADKNKRIWTEFCQTCQKLPQHQHQHLNNNANQATFAKKQDKLNQQHLSLEIQHQLCSLTLAFCKVLLIFALFCTLFSAIFVLHKPTESFVLRNTQDLIYPFMRTLRLFNLPILHRASFLTEFYDDSCLLQNSYFTVDSVQCWSCESVHQVIDFRHARNLSIEFSDSGIPFVVQTKFLSIFDVHAILDIYDRSDSDKEHFWNSIGMRDDFHLMWEINRVTTARALRGYFPKPFFIPTTTEVSIQHFLFVDHSKAKSYALPLPEFTNVFVTQVSGERYFVLIPTLGCQDVCHKVSIVLHEGDILFYNWLYWRPVSVPVPVQMQFANDTSATFAKNFSVTYVGSFY